MKDLILIGGGGHCKSCIEVIKQTNIYNIIGILDKKENINKKVLDYKIIGTDDDIDEFILKDYSFFITIGQIKNSKKRELIFNKLIEKNASIPYIISPRSYISNSVQIGAGTIIMNDVFINTECYIGSNNIINNKSLIEHDVKIGNNNHISTSCTLNGSVTIKNNTFIGSGTIINNNLKIGSNIIIGSGSLITQNLSKEGTYVGLIKA